MSEGAPALTNEGCGPLHLEIVKEQWPLTVPFRIAGHTFEVLGVIVVTLRARSALGRGEAVGVYYRNDTASSLVERIEAVRPAVEKGVCLEQLQALLPPGGARNALDCAWWDLQAQLSGQPVWEMAGLGVPKPLVTTFTCGADTPENMGAAARRYSHARAIKLKLTGASLDADRVRAVREARPDVWLGVDANQSFTRASLAALMPVLVENQVSLIEQPFPVDKDALLVGLQSPIPIAADESVQSRTDIPKLAGKVDVINIKLDKCGGLTEALSMVRAAHACGLETMVGNMVGTSLAMAPAFLVGQQCKVVDLDGPVFLAADRTPAVTYEDGLIHCPAGLWGSPISGVTA